MKIKYRLLLLVCMVLVPVCAAAAQAQEAKKDADPVAGEYIVDLGDEAKEKTKGGVEKALKNADPEAMLKNGPPEEAKKPVRDEAAKQAQKAGAKLKDVHETLGVYSVVADEKAAQKLADDPDVASVTQNGKVTAHAQAPLSALPGIDRVDADTSSQRSGNGSGALPLPGVAHLDTGVPRTNTDLTLLAGYNCTSSPYGYSDVNGHGSHTAGTSIAQDDADGVVGTDPGAYFVGIKVLGDDGVGTWDQTLCGINAENIYSYYGYAKVANYSIGAPAGFTIHNDCGVTDNDPVHKAFCASARAPYNVVWVVSAGNDAADTSGVRPAGYDDAVITVSALTDSDGQPGGLGAPPACRPGEQDDTFAAFSNHGSAVDLGAPGVCVLSMWWDGSTRVLSGTSMAAPHVTGAAALYRSKNPSATFAQVRDALKAQGEPLGGGHSDPSGKHPEPVLQMDGL